MNSTWGERLKLDIFGESHGPEIGMVLQGIPAGLKVDFDKLQEFLDRRAPGNSCYSSARREADRPIFQTGLTDGITTGESIRAVIQNTNVRRSDYDELTDTPRPGHVDYAARMKYGKDIDLSGGGHFSGRLTAPLCIAGGMCKQWLESRGIRIGAHIDSIGGIQDDRFDPLNPQLDDVCAPFPVLNQETGADMKALIAKTRDQKDSVGGWIEVAVTGLPAGIGGPMFSGMESRISQIVYGIPGVKGILFGDTAMFGSENNDPFAIGGQGVTTLTNHCGGILGGITNGMPLLFRVLVKPTPSIGISQQTISLSRMENTTIEIKGRHDPCILPRAVAVMEAAAALAIYELLI